MSIFRISFVSFLIMLAAALSAAAQLPSLKTLAEADVFDAGKDKFSIRLPKVPGETKPLNAADVANVGTGMQFSWMFKEGVVFITHISFKSDLFNKKSVQASYSEGFVEGFLEGFNGKKTGQTTLERAGYTALQFTFDIPNLGQGKCRSYTSGSDHFIVLVAGYKEGGEEEKLLTAVLDSFKVPAAADFAAASKDEPPAAVMGPSRAASPSKEAPPKPVEIAPAPSLKDMPESEVFSSAEDKFSIALPKKAVVHTNSATGLNPIGPTSSYEWRLKETYITVARFSADAGVPKNAGEFQAFASLVKNTVLKGTNGTLVSEKAIMLGDAQGLEMHFTVFEKMFHAVSRIYVVGNSIYTLTAVYQPSEAEGERLSLRAFDTFKVLGAPEKSVGE